MDFQRADLFLPYELGADIESNRPFRIRNLLGGHHDQAIAVLLVALRTGRLWHGCGQKTSANEENALHRTLPLR